MKSALSKGVLRTNSIPHVADITSDWQYPSEHIRARGKRIPITEVHPPPMVGDLRAIYPSESPWSNIEATSIVGELHGEVVVLSDPGDF